LLLPRRRAVNALLAVVQEAHVHGVSTRKVGDLVKPCRRRHLEVGGVAHLRRFRTIGAIVRTIFAQPDHAFGHDATPEGRRLLAGGLPARPPSSKRRPRDMLADPHLPLEHRRQLHSTNSLERLNKETKCRSNAIGIFPNPAAVIRLVAAVLIEQDEEWAVTTRRRSGSNRVRLRLSDCARPHHLTGHYPARLSDETCVCVRPAFGQVLLIAGPIRPGAAGKVSPYSAVLASLAARASCSAS
jgi:hypothetical protein